MPRWQLLSVTVLLLAGPAAPAAEITEPGRHLARVLDGMHVEDHWLPDEQVDWRTGAPDPKAPHSHTHCSAFVAAACERLGVYILRPPEHSQTFLANAQQEWLRGQGRARGWEPVSSGEEAQRLANRGDVVVASYHNPNPRKPGHVALVRPSTKSDRRIAAEGPEVIFAGIHNHNRASLVVGFRHHPRGQIVFFAHRAER